MAAAQPFLKWAGGKRAILDTLGPILTEGGPWRTYHEPFVGGGAAFFHLKAAGGFQRASLGDANPHLMRTYEAIQDDVEGTIHRMEAHAKHHGETRYALVRTTLSQTLDHEPAVTAAAVIYLNRTGYNGLWRVNRQGSFNVPLGVRSEPKMPNRERLRTVHRTLQGVTLRTGPFHEITVRPGDLVYADPPYDGTYTAYASEGFGWEDQIRLANVAKRWRSKGARVVISNADTPRIRALYQENWTTTAVNAPRAISRNPNTRAPARELILVGEPTEH